MDDSEDGIVIDMDESDVDYLARTQWLRFADVTDAGDRYEAAIHTQYFSNRDEEWEYGTIDREAVDELKNDGRVAPHVMRDGSITLSGLDDDVRDELLATWEPNDG